MLRVPTTLIMLYYSAPDAICCLFKTLSLWAVYNCLISKEIKYCRVMFRLKPKICYRAHDLNKNMLFNTSMKKKYIFYLNKVKYK